MHSSTIHSLGRDLSEAKKALILLHGRGGNARDILSLGESLKLKDYALLAPQATGNTWYPYSFLAEPAENEPGLSSALETVKNLVADIKSKGILSENIYFLGFSQGACLCLEFIARNAEHYGGVIAFTGGLIGDKIYREHYRGDFLGTRVFIGTGDPDMHVPVKRVRASADLLKKMNAQVHVTIYENRPHTISQDEMVQAQKILTG